MVVSLHLGLHTAFGGVCVGFVYCFVPGFLLTEHEGDIQAEAAHFLKLRRCLCCQLAAAVPRPRRGGVTGSRTGTARSGSTVFRPPGFTGRGCP